LKTANNDVDWTHALVLRTYEDDVSMTNKIRKLSPLEIHTWGGFAESGGDMASLLTNK